MFLQHIALAIGVLASTSAVSPGPDSKIFTPEFSATARSLIVDPSAVTTKRILRVHEQTRIGSEERALVGFNVDGLAQTLVHNPHIADILKTRTGYTLVDSFLEALTLNPKVREMLRKKETAKAAFRVLGVDKATGNLLESQQWKDWAVYVAKLNKDTPDESLAAAMSVEFGVDGLSRLLAKAVMDPNTKEIATKLENAQLSRWVNSKAKPVRIFEVLKLNEKTDNIFESPEFATWTNYLKAFNKKENNDIAEVDVLKHYYKEEGLLQLLGSKENINTARTKTYLDELSKRWLDEPTHPLNVFNKMKLNEAGDDLLTSPLLSTWVEYMKAFNKQYSFAETTMIKTFTKSYGDEKLAVMLQAATKAPDADTAKFAKNLQEAQFKQWMLDRLTPDDLFKTVLKLDSTSSPNADIWRAYYKAYDERFPGKLFSFNA